MRCSELQDLNGRDDLEERAATGHYTSRVTRRQRDCQSPGGGVASAACSVTMHRRSCNACNGNPVSLSKQLVLRTSLKRQVGDNDLAGGMEQLCNLTYVNRWSWVNVGGTLTADDAGTRVLRRGEASRLKSWPTYG